VQAAGAIFKLPAGADSPHLSRTVMNLILIRHAIAEERDAFAESGQEDSFRPLTSEGKKKMKRGAAGLRRVTPTIDLLASSPLVRAKDTAEIVMKEYGLSRIELVDALVPDARPTQFLQWLRGVQVDTVAAVGHEPHLSQLASWLVGGMLDPWIALKKGGACAIRFTARPRSGGGMVEWVLTPSQLRQLGR
jgi:phosphohistidine phosphatase